MNSLFAQLFLQLQAHITAKVPEIRWIDQDLGQLEWYEMRPAVSWPCCLIDFNQTSFDQMQQGKQQGNITFTLRLGFENYSASASTAPQAVKEKSLQYYELEQKLYEAVQGFDAGGLMQDCTRINSATEKREGDNFRVRVLTFTSLVDDSSAAQVYFKARPKIGFEVHASDGVGVQAIGEDFTIN